MNQRIQELAEQAHNESYTVYLNRQQTEGAANVIFYDIFAERFAELVEKDAEAKHFSAGYTAGQSDGTIETVKQCLTLCDQVDLAGADDCIAAIKEHFGVES